MDPSWFLPNVTDDVIDDDMAINNTPGIRHNCTFDVGRIGPEYYVYFCISVPLSILTILGNSLILDAHRRNRKARSATFHPIILLAISDLCTGIIQPIMAVLYYVRKNIGDTEYIQLMNYCVYFISVAASVLALLGLTIDRFTGTVFPLRYRSFVTFKRSVGMTVGVFLPALLGGLVVPLVWHNKYDPEICYTDWDLLQILDPRYLQYFVLPSFFLSSLAFVVFFSSIVIIARRHLHGMTKARCAGSSDKETIAHRKASEAKLLKTTLFILIGFYACWLPLIIALSLQVYGHEYYVTDYVTIAVRSFATIPASVNSVINPAIYAFRIPLFRAHVRKVFRRFKCADSGSPGVSRESRSASVITITSHF